jgi:hypothetical protein
MATALLTKLDAVNSMLAAIWERPVSSLDSGGASSLSAAKKILDDTLRSVLSRGWIFNVEDNYPLSVDANGRIPLPANTIKVDAGSEEFRYTDIVQRGQYLYDRKDHTYTFTAPVKAEITLFLEFDEIPEAARAYIAAFAARRFKAEWLNQPEGPVTAAEAEALRNLEHYEAETGDYNILSGSYGVARILQRW